MKVIPVGTPRAALSKSACNFLIKSACFAAAVSVAGVAFNYFLQLPAEPIIDDELQLQSLEQKIGNGNSEECRAALSAYPLSNTDFRKIVDAVGGAEAFCNLPAFSNKPLELSRGYFFLALGTSETAEVTQHPEEKVIFKEDENYSNIYHQLKNSWVLASCDKYARCETKNLDDREIEDLGRLIRGETICRKTQENEWISTQVCKKLI